MSMVHATQGAASRPHGGTCAARWRSSAPGEATLPAVPVDWAACAATTIRIRGTSRAWCPASSDFERASRAGRVRCCPTRPATSAGFPTPSGRKARFTVNELTAVDCADGRLLLQTVRSHDQYNTTIYGLDDRYRGITAAGGWCSCNPDDLRRSASPTAQVVDLVSEWPDGTDRRAPRLPGRRLPDRPALRRGLLPRGQRAGAARLDHTPAAEMKLPVSFEAKSLRWAQVADGAPGRTPSTTKTGSSSTPSVSTPAAGARLTRDDRSPP
jgi:hypothetical protein